VFEAPHDIELNHALDPVFLYTKGYPFYANDIEMVDGLLSAPNQWGYRRAAFFDSASPRSGIWNHFAKLRKFHRIFRKIDYRNKENKIVLNE